MKIVKSVSSVLVLTMLVTGSVFGGGNGKGKTVSREQVYPPVPAALRTPYALANSYSPVSSSSSSSGSSSTTKSASSTSSAIAHAASSRDRDIEMQDVAIKLDSKFAAEDKTGCWGRYKQAFADAVKRNWDKLSPKTQKIISKTGQLTGVFALGCAVWISSLTGDDYISEVTPGILGAVSLWITRDDSYFVQTLEACGMAGISAPFYYFGYINVPLQTAGWFLFNATLKKIVDIVKPKKDVQVQCDMI